jgi:hypothetical protein
LPPGASLPKPLVEQTTAATLMPTIQLALASLHQAFTFNSTTPVTVKESADGPIVTACANLCARYRRFFSFLAVILCSIKPADADLLKGL